MCPACDSSSEEQLLSSSSSGESASASASDSTRAITSLAAGEAGCETSARQDAEFLKLLGRPERAGLRGGLACVAGFLRGGLWPAAAAALSAAATGFLFARDGCARFACAFAAARGGSARFAGALATGFFFFFPACHRRAGGGARLQLSATLHPVFRAALPGRQSKAGLRAGVVPPWDWPEASAGA